MSCSKNRESASRPSRSGMNKNANGKRQRSNSAIHSMFFWTSSTFTANSKENQKNCSCLSPMERSEEHTSELQSRLHLVCRLLLEKKKYGAEIPARHAGDGSI